MQLLVVGGHTRNIGKTALVVDLLRAFPEAAWTAVKITQYGHGLCSREGRACDCAPDEHMFAIDEEQERKSGSDTSRFLAAGAAHAFWLRTKQGRLAEALPLLRETLDRTAGSDGNVIVESNTLLNFLRPRLYLVVLDPTQEDFKESARFHLDRADALVLRHPLAGPTSIPVDSQGAVWGADFPWQVIQGIPRYQQALGDPLPEPMVKFVSRVFFGSGAQLG
jgi:molybdopterin-guanine dinucleotide biosynthesis protein